jgi:hypothetical protein
VARGKWPGARVRADDEDVGAGVREWLYFEPVVSAIDPTDLTNNLLAMIYQVALWRPELANCMADRQIS